MEVMASIADYERCESGAEVDFTRCVSCKRQTREPLLLDCLHAICHDCFVSQIGIGSNGKVLCEICGRFTALPSRGPAVLPVHHVSIHQRTANPGEDTKAKCDECCSEEADRAVCYCRTCGLLLCSFHKKAHSKSRRTRDHILGDVGEHTAATLSTGSTAVLCKLHNKPKTRYCSSCAECFCADCEHCDGKHTVHDLTASNADEIFQATRQALERRLAKELGDGRFDKLQQLEELAGKRIEEVDTRAEAVSREISAFFEELCSELMRRKKLLLEKVARLRSSIKLPLEEVQVEAKQAKRLGVIAKEMGRKASQLADETAQIELHGAIEKQLEKWNAEVDSMLTTDLAEKVPIEQVLSFQPTDVVKELSNSAHVDTVGHVGAVRVTKMDAVKCMDETLSVTCHLAWINENCIWADNVFQETKTESIVQLWGGLQFTLSCSGSVSDSAASSCAHANNHPLEAIGGLKLSQSNDGVVVMARLGVAGEEKIPEESTVTIKQNDEPVLSCVVTASWTIDQKSCPSSVRLEEDNRKIVLEELPVEFIDEDANASVLVGTVPLSRGQHTWKIRIDAQDQREEVRFGVTTKAAGYSGYAEEGFTGWCFNKDSFNYPIPYIDFYTDSCFHKFNNGQGESIGSESKGFLVGPPEVIFITLDCEAATLTVSNPIRQQSDIIKGIGGPVFPCFGLHKKGIHVSLVD